MDPFGHQNVTEHTYGGDLMMGQGLSRATTGTVMMAGQQHSGGGFQGEWRNGAAGERHTTYTSERVQLDQPTSSRNISYEGHRQNSRAAGPPSYSFHEHNGQAYPYTSGMSSGLTMQHDMAGILNGTTSNDHEVEKAVYYPKLDPIMQTPPFTPSLHDTFNHPTPERSSFPGPDPTMTPPFTPSPFPFFTDAKPRRTSHSSLLGYISNTAPASSAASVPSQDLMRPEDDHVSAIDPTPAPTEEMYKCREGCNKTFEKGAFRTSVSSHDRHHSNIDNIPDVTKNNTPSRTSAPTRVATVASEAMAFRDPIMYTITQGGCMVYFGRGIVVLVLRNRLEGSQRRRSGRSLRPRF